MPRPDPSARALGLTIPLTAGAILFGWRAGLVALLVVGGALAATAGEKFIAKKRGRPSEAIRYGRSAWLALLLAAMLPAVLAGGKTAGGWPLWPAAVGAGVLLVAVDWLIEGAAALRVDALVVAYLAVYVVLAGSLVPHRTLDPRRAVLGDLLDTDAAQAAAGPVGAPRETPWYHLFRLPTRPAHDAIFAEPATQRLTFFTTGTAAPDRAWLSMGSVLRDQLPPLEDLIIGGQPAPLGQGSAVATIFGGLFLLYRGAADWRVPAAVLGFAYAAFAVLPVPVGIGQGGPQFRWVAPSLAGVGWPTGLTLVHYEVFAGPLVFVAFFLAPLSPLLPPGWKGRVAFSALLGMGAAGLSLYVSSAIGPYLALLGVGMLAKNLVRRTGRP